jgi:acyl-CoA reductase-like NAD-dependent aldehyde dehydrogenase
VRVLSHFIDGQRAAGASRRFGEVFDPAQGRVAARVPLANAAEVAAAKAAFPAWSETAPLKRARLMFKFKQLLEAHHDKLAELITRDHGKLFSDAKVEVLRGIEIVEFACGISNLLKTDFSDQIGGGMEPDLDMGPLVTAAHRAKVSGYIDAGVAAGAKLVVDGRGHTVPSHEEAFLAARSLTT